MAVIGNFTDVSYIKNRGEFTVTSTKDNVNINVKIYFGRTNGYTTTGNCNVDLYFNGKLAVANFYNKYVTLPKYSATGDPTVLVCDKTYQIARNKFGTTSFTIGYACRSEANNPNAGGGPVSQLTTNGNVHSTSTISVGAYASHPTAVSPSISFDSQNNVVSFVGSGVDGTNNPIIAQRIYYKLPGDSVYRKADPAGYTASATLTSSGTVYAYTQIQGSLLDVVQSPVASKSITMSGNLQTPTGLTIQTDTPTMTTNSKFTFSWNSVPPSGSTQVKWYIVSVEQNGEVKYTNITTSTTIASISIPNLMSGGVKLKVQAIATVSGRDSGVAEKSFEVISSGGYVFVKSVSQLVNGLIYIKTSSGIVESSNVYIRTPNGWKESKQ